MNMKYYEKNEKPIPFLEVWRREDDENGGFFFLNETQWVCERDEWIRQWIVKNVRGKTKNF